MKALALTGPGQVHLTDIAEPERRAGELLLRVNLVGLCGTALNSYRGKNPLVTYPRILGHEIAATVLEGTSAVPAGTRVVVSPYTHCGQCAACLRGRVNACKFNQTFGVQRDGAMTELLTVPEGKVYPSSLSLKELCLVEPLTVGMHAVSRAKVGTWSYFIQYAQQYGHVRERTAGLLLTGTLGAFGIGRFASSYLMRRLQPSRLMGWYAVLNVVLLLVGIALSGWIGLGAIFLTSFFMSVMFPTIFAMGLKDPGPNTNLAGSLLVMTIIGGAVGTPLMGLLAERTHSTAVSYCLPLVGYPADACSV